jgi:hypothetical protein
MRGLPRVLLIACLFAAVVAGIASAASPGFVKTDAPSPSPSTMSAVSCATATWCFAIGEYPNHSRSSSLILADRWNGKSWRKITAPTPANGHTKGVGCASNRSCILVGLKQPSFNVSSPFAERWNGRRWRVTTLPAVPGSDGWLDGVTCATPTHCVAVGTAEAQTAAQTGLIDTWNGRHWTKRRFGAKVVLNSVSCSSASDCWAAGFIEHTSTGVLIRIDASGDHLVDSPTKGALESVSCPTATTCWAVGDKLIGLSNGTWQAYANPTQFYGTFASISCVTDTSCTVVGDRGMGSGTWAGAWDGSAWTALSTPSGKGAFQGVSCPDATLCVAAGFTGRGLGRALVAWQKAG